MRYGLLFVVLFACLPLNAKDLGRIGPTFKIGEIDMLAWIDARLKHFEKTGKMDELKENFTQQVKQSVENPTPLELSTTTEPTSFLVDPSIVIPQDLMDLEGNVFAKAGTKVNPFDTSTWPSHAKLPQFTYSHVLLFFDARDIEQITFVANFKHDKPIKYIMTGGNHNEAAKQLKNRMYFDQQGTLTKKLHIQSVPSLVEQDATMWRVTEFDVHSSKVQSP